MEIEKQIRRLRESKGYSQEYMAVQLGMSQNGYCKIENGKVDVKAKTLQMIAEVLDVDLYQLFVVPYGTNPVLSDNSDRYPVKNDKGFSERERQLYEQLKTITEVHMVTQHKLILHYEEEIKHLRSQLGGLPKDVIVKTPHETSIRAGAEHGS
jgi:transcriptional regulator with XRE-family HTH domain